MKAKKIVVLSVIMVSMLILSSYKTAPIANDTVSEILIQKGFIVYAAYSGHEDSGYIFKVKDRNGNEQTLTFQKIKAAVLKAFDLRSDALIGTKFKITFNKDTSGTGGAEVNTITSLEKMQKAY